MKLLTSLLLAGCVAGLAPVVASAQVTTADLVGTIGYQRRVVPGVTVALTNEATGVSRSSPPPATAAPTSSRRCSPAATS